MFGMYIKKWDSLWIGGFAWSFAWTMSFHPYFLPDLKQKALSKGYRFSFLHLAYRYVMWIHRQYVRERPYDGFSAMFVRWQANLFPFLFLLSLFQLPFPWKTWMWGLLIAELYGGFASAMFKTKNIEG
jgi:hypothetical protein